MQQIFHIGIGNGFPLAAVVTTPEIAENLNKALHFNTFGGNPLACSVGIAVLEVMDNVTQDIFLRGFLPFRLLKKKNCSKTVKRSARIC